jgi:hypothetical protein
MTGKFFRNNWFDRLEGGEISIRMRLLRASLLLIKSLLPLTAEARGKNRRYPLQIG